MKFSLLAVLVLMSATSSAFANTTPRTAKSYETSTVETAVLLGALAKMGKSFASHESQGIQPYGAQIECSGPGDISGFKCVARSIAGFSVDRSAPVALPLKASILVKQILSKNDFSYLIDVYGTPEPRNALGAVLRCYEESDTGRPDAKDSCEFSEN